MFEPPLKFGVKSIVTCPFPLVTFVIVGAVGVVAGVIGELEVEALLVPTSFVAVTVNVYSTPFVRPVIVCERFVEPASISTPPPLDVTVYPVIAEPPLLPVNVKVTVACPFPLVAVPIVGASGVVAGVTELLGND